MSDKKYADQWDRWWEQKRDVRLLLGRDGRIYFATLNPILRYLARECKSVRIQSAPRSGT